MGLKKHFNDAMVSYDFVILALYYKGLQDCIVGVYKCFYDAMSNVTLQFICLLYNKP